jgi:GDPmannose 4,6-dehydratase
MAMTCIITGVRGQDGLLLSERLVSLGINVVGISSHAERDLHYPSLIAYTKLRSNPKFFAVSSDYSAGQLTELFSIHQPKIVFHFAGISRAFDRKVDWQNLYHSNVLVTQSLLASCLSLPKIPIFFLASSAESIELDILDGKIMRSPSASLRSAYGLSKKAATDICRYYRDRIGLPIFIGHFFNHESIYRAPHFIFRKISLGVAAVELGIADRLPIGDLNVSRDWGCANEYMEIVSALALEHEPTEVEIGTGKLSQLGSIAEFAFSAVNKNCHDYLAITPELMRENTDKLVVGADTAKLTMLLGRVPKVSAHDTIAEMVQADIHLLKSLDREKRAELLGLVFKY